MVSLAPMWMRDGLVVGTPELSSGTVALVRSERMCVCVCVLAFSTWVGLLPAINSRNWKLTASAIQI